MIHTRSRFSQLGRKNVKLGAAPTVSEKLLVAALIGNLERRSLINGRLPLG